MRAVYQSVAGDAIEATLNMPSFILEQTQKVFAKEGASPEERLTSLRILQGYTYGRLDIDGQAAYLGLLTQAHKDGIINTDAYMHGFYSIYNDVLAAKTGAVHSFLQRLALDKTFGNVEHFNDIRVRAGFLANLAHGDEGILSYETRVLAGRVARRFLYEKEGHLQDSLKVIIPKVLEHASPRNQARLARVFAHQLTSRALYNGVCVRDLHNVKAIGQFLPQSETQGWLSDMIKQGFEGYREDDYLLSFTELRDLYRFLKTQPRDADLAKAYTELVVLAADKGRIAEFRRHLFLRRGVELLPRDERFDACMAYIEGFEADNRAVILDFALLAHRFAQNDTQKAQAKDKVLATGLVVDGTPARAVGAVQDLFRQQAEPVQAYGHGVRVWNALRTPCFVQDTAQKGNPKVRFYTIAGSLDVVQAEVEKRYTAIHPRRKQFDAFKLVIGQ